MKRSHLILLLTLLIATTLRLYKLDTHPLGLYHDEAYNGLDALALANGDTFPQFHEAWELYAQEAHADRPPTPTRTPIFFEGNYGREPLHIYLMALSVSILGNTVLAIRIIPALAGILSTLTTYLTAKTLTKSETTALIASFTVAVLFPAIHFSRFGLRVMLFVPVACLAVIFFWRGLDTASRVPARRVPTQWLIAGGLIGSTLYIYAASRLFPLVFALYFIIHLRHKWKEFIALGLTALLIASPLLLYFYHYPYFFIFRSSFVANRGKGVVEGKPLVTWFFNIGRVIQGIFWQGETHLRHNLPGRPYLDPIQAIFFIIGTLQRPKKEHQFVIIWLIVMLLPSIMSGDAPHFGRMTGAIPPIAILTAVGANAIIQRFQKTSWLVVGLLVCSLGLTLNAYFLTYASHPELASGIYPIDNGFYHGEVRLAETIGQHTTDTAYLVPPQAETATILYLLPQETTIRTLDPTTDFVPLGERDKHALYLVRPDARDAISALQDQAGTTLKNAKLEFETHRSLTESSVANTVNHRFQDHTILLDVVTESSADYHEITVYYEAVAPTETLHTGYVHLLDADGALVAQQDVQTIGYPTSDWRPAEIIKATFQLPNLPEGRSIAIGFYESATVTPLGTPYEATLQR